MVVIISPKYHSFFSLRRIYIWGHWLPELIQCTARLWAVFPRHTTIPDHHQTVFFKALRKRQYNDTGSLIRTRNLFVIIQYTLTTVPTLNLISLYSLVFLYNFLIQIFYFNSSYTSQILFWNYTKFVHCFVVELVKIKLKRSY